MEVHAQNRDNVVSLMVGQSHEQCTAVAIDRSAEADSGSEVPEVRLRREYLGRVARAQVAPNAIPEVHQCQLSALSRRSHSSLTQAKAQQRDVLRAMVKSHWRALGGQVKGQARPESVARPRDIDGVRLHAHRAEADRPVSMPRRRPA